jgi:hypothetical protein
MFQDSPIASAPTIIAGSLLLIEGSISLTPMARDRVSIDDNRLHIFIATFLFCSLG